MSTRPGAVTGKGARGGTLVMRWSGAPSAASFASPAASGGRVELLMRMWRRNGRLVQEMGESGNRTCFLSPRPARPSVRAAPPADMSTAHTGAPARNNPEREDLLVVEDGQRKCAPRLNAAPCAAQGAAFGEGRVHCILTPFAPRSWREG